jgi:hypothetical protein
VATVRGDRGLMPRYWLVAMAVLGVCLVASIVIGTVKLIETPTETLKIAPSFSDREWRGLLPRR